MVDTKLIDKLKIVYGEKLYINDYLILSSISLFFFLTFHTSQFAYNIFYIPVQITPASAISNKKSFCSVFVYNKINKTCTIRYFKICSKNGQLLVCKTKQTTSTSLYVSERQHPCSFGESSRPTICWNFHWYQMCPIDSRSIFVF